MVRYTPLRLIAVLLCFHGTDAQGSTDSTTPTPLTDADMSVLIASQTALTNAFMSLSNSLDMTFSGIEEQQDQLHAMVNQIRMTQTEQQASQERQEDSQSRQETQLQTAIDEIRALQSKTDKRSQALVEFLFEQPAMTPSSKYYLSKPILDANIDTAVGVCTALGGHLAEIDDQAEHDFIKAYMNTHPIVPDTHGGVFISGTDVHQENTWLHERDSRIVTHFSWGPSQPDNSGRGEDCMELWGDEHWEMNDQPCGFDDDGQRFICEFPVDHQGGFTLPWTVTSPGTTTPGTTTPVTAVRH